MINLWRYLTCHCSWAARIALVKCRDLHWAMMAHREQRDTSLASLRMLIVADGANPCEYFVTLQLCKKRYFQATQMRCNMSNPYFLPSRVGVFLWCLPERVPVPRAETWGHLSLCHLPRGYDSSYTQVCNIFFFCKIVILGEKDRLNKKGCFFP